MVLRTILLLLLLLALQTHSAAEVPALLQKLERTAVGDSGITPAEDEVASEIHKIGAPAIPGLIALLQHKDAGVRTLAGYVLRDIDGLKPEHLEPLIAGYKAGSDWLPPAIAKTRHPDAAPFLVAEYFRKRAMQSQLDWPIVRLGEQAVKPLIEAVREMSELDDSLSPCVTHIFRELGSSAKSGIPALAELVKDEHTSEPVRIAALLAIGGIGHHAAHVAPLLNELRAGQSKALHEAAEDALIRIGSTQGMAILAERLAQSKNYLFLRDIAEHGERGRVIGADVARYLEDHDWEIRLAAARTLGFIGYQAAAPALTAALRSPEDWRLSWAAAESLGRLRISEAKDALATTAKDHWYRPVREAAETALRSIEGAEPYAEQDKQELHFPFRYFAHDSVGGFLDLEEDDFARIRFQHVPQQTAVAVPDPKSRASYRGIPVTGGKIVGSDRGEWGGELVYVDARNKMEVLAHENTFAIFGGKERAIALTGLAHITLNTGIAYKVERDEKGNWSAKRWRALPGAPRHARLLEHGDILVVCVSGSVILSPDGRMKELTREELIAP